MLEPYDGKLSRTVLRREGGGNTADPADYAPLVERLHGQVIHIGPASTQYINPMDINSNYSEEDNPLALKADFILSLCELVVGGKRACNQSKRRLLTAVFMWSTASISRIPPRKTCPCWKICTTLC